MEMAVTTTEARDLISKLNNFRDRFDATQVEKSTAMFLAQQLEQLSKHIRDNYLTEEGNYERRKLKKDADIGNSYPGGKRDRKDLLEDPDQSEESYNERWTDGVSPGRRGRTTAHKRRMEDDADSCTSDLEEVKQANESQETNHKRKKVADDNCPTLEETNHGRMKQLHDGCLSIKEATPSPEQKGEFDDIDGHLSQVISHKHTNEAGSSSPRESTNHNYSDEKLNHGQTKKNDVYSRHLIAEANRKIREREAAEISKLSKKPPSRPMCGVAYPGGPDDRAYSDDIKKRIQSNIPGLKLNRNLFLYMAFATLDRVYCPMCSCCTNEISKLEQWVKLGRVAEESQLLSGTSDKPLIPRSISLPMGFEGTRSNVSTNALDSFNVLVAIDEIVQWYELGLSLGLSTTTLNTIQQECSNSVARCKIKVVEKWLTLGGNTWQNLICAIRGPLIKNCSLAEKIEEKYVHN